MGVISGILKKVFGGLFVAVFAVVLLNGLADVAYQTTYSLRAYVQLAAKEYRVKAQKLGDEGDQKRDLQPFLDYEQRYIAGLGHLVLPIQNGEMHVLADGRRLAPGEAIDPPGPRMAVLGASQAFGVFNSADGMLSAELDSLVPGYSVMNYAVPGQRLSQNSAHLEYLVRQGVQIDYALFVAGPVDVMYHCVHVPTERSYIKDKERMRMMNIIVKAQEIYSPRQVDYDCGPEMPGTVSVSDRLRIEMRGALATAEALGIPASVVFHPVPYDGTKADRSNLEDDWYFQVLAASMTPVFREFSKRLQEQPIPSVYDLSGAFAGHPPLFYDVGAHIVDEGQAILARAIVDTIDFSQPENAVSGN